MTKQQTWEERWDEFSKELFMHDDENFDHDALKDFIRAELQRQRESIVEEIMGMKKKYQDEKMGFCQERCLNCGKLCEPIMFSDKDIANIHRCVKWNLATIDDKPECSCERTYEKKGAFIHIKHDCPIHGIEAETNGGECCECQCHRTMRPHKEGHGCCDGAIRSENSQKDFVFMKKTGAYSLGREPKGNGLISEKLFIKTKPEKIEDNRYCQNCLIAYGYKNCGIDECECECHKTKPARKIEKINCCKPGTHVDLSYPARHEDLLVMTEKLNEVIKAVNSLKEGE